MRAVGSQSTARQTKHAQEANSTAGTRTRKAPRRADQRVAGMPGAELA